MAEGEEDSLELAKKYDDFLEGKWQMTAYNELEKMGQAPAPIEGLSDEDVTRELTNLVWGLADLGCYISSTDHMSDRELYTALLEYCDQPQAFFPKNKRACIGWLGTEYGEDEDNQIYLRYYADDRTRKEFAEEFGVNVPPKETAPYPRPWLPVWEPPID